MLPEQKMESGLLKKIEGMEDVLAGAGVGHTDYIDQLTYLLFLKMDSEGKEYETDSLIPEDCKWESLMGLSGDDLVEAYEDILKKLSERPGLVGTIFAGATNKIKQPVYLQKLLNMVNEDNWFMMNSDIKGDIYEKVLEKNGQDIKGGAGQYFTPRSLIGAIVDVINPRIGETVGDPCCGTGGFLISAYDHMFNQSRDPEKVNFLKSNALFGADIVPNVVTLASMNLYLRDIGRDKSPIVYQDSLVQDSDRVFDVVMTNPPFGKRSQGSVDVSASRPEFIPTTDNQVNFLQHIMSIVKTGGRAAVVIPDSVLNATDNATRKVREKLLGEYNLHTILRLPTGIFYSQGVHTSVLFFDKGEATKDIWVYDYRTGIKHTLQDHPLTRADLQDFVDCYCSGHMEDRKETYDANLNPNGRWRKFTEGEIKKQENIDFTWIDLEEKDKRSVSELMSEVQKDAKGINDAVMKLRELLEGIEF